MSKLSKTVTVLVLVLSLGLHWTLLQSAAWISMIVRYSQDYPLRQAIRMTFDGEHPCSICKFVSHGRQQEEEQDSPSKLTVLKLESIAFEPLLLTFPSAAPEPTVFARLAPPERSEPPPFPPPRLARLLIRNIPGCSSGGALGSSDLCHLRWEDRGRTEPDPAYGFPRTPFRWKPDCELDGSTTL